MLGTDIIFAERRAKIQLEKNFYIELKLWV